MKKPLMQIDFPCSFDAYELSLKVGAMLVDMTEQAVVQECIKAAEENGFTRLCLIDKKFIVDAIREKMERERLMDE